MILAACKHDQTKKHGRDPYGNQRHRCILCGKTWIDRQARPLGDMRIPQAKAVLTLKMLLEGASIRAIERIVGINRNTIMALLLLVGERCQIFWEARFVRLEARTIEVDELWGFVGCKEKQRVALNRGKFAGDVYTFLALDADTKLVLNYHNGKRDMPSTIAFLEKLRDSIVGNCQITTDGFGAYTNAVPAILWRKHIDFAQLVKIFSTQQPRDAARYSPAPIIGLIKKVVWGNPDKSRVSTSYCERLNLSVRMGIRRMTRLTNAFSKSWRHHEAAMALWLTFYNFCRIHQTLKTTPAVAAKLADRPWSIERLLNELATKC